MNRLEIARMTRRLAGIGAGATGNGPTSTVGQTGEYQRLVGWNDSAWAEIQRDHLFNFMWEQAGVVIAAGQNAKAEGLAARRYVHRSARIGLKRLTYLPWAAFAERFPVDLIGPGEPSTWSVRPDKVVVVDRKPLAETTINLERYGRPVPMTTDEDVPAMPEEHHEAIVYRSLLLYANFEEAGVTRATAEAEYNRHMAALAIEELPDFTFGDPLC